MKRAIRGLMWVMLSTALVVMAPRAFAQRPPETHPVSTHQDIVMSWDRSAMPGDVELQVPRKLIAYDHLDLARQYGRLHLVCESSNDARRGACPTEGVNSLLVGPQPIRLTFAESRSGLTTQLAVLGGIERAMSGRSCREDFWMFGISAPWSSFAQTCSRDVAVGTGYTLFLPADEVQKLVAGTWSASLSLELRSPSARNLATFSYDLSFTVTDRNAVAIYFPQFDGIAPHVGMNLRYDPIAQTVGGGTTVDMCLYDGLGSNAAYLGVTVRDSGARAPGPLGFSAWHRDSGGSGDSERLDYTVTLDHSGALIPMRNGIEEQLTGIDSAKLKLVLLPGMSQPVFCVHTPLRLEMPRVPIAGKQPGYYRGDLKVELRVPTGVP
ncbi:CfaE/CblD family pilus tip adhesin [Stenotrophomonas sp. CC120223-11]|uniref:CfaE/CblD family pilus tip adhesin n=1 Tax=Stenotrophomonas sp. CC120223-11 TaxID=1378090 RepID=UPI000BE291A9|nr:CfaE/CblD family pilus tip adhesin [Stenotrophomonas sp. CC120223-11]